MPIVVELTPVTPGTEIVLDPIEIADGRQELHLNAGDIRVAQEGIDWGDAAIEPYMAALRRGQLPVDFRVPNRTIQIPLLLGASTSAGYSTARRELQAKVALLQSEQGFIRRDTLYADIVNATLKLPDKYGTWLGVEADVVLTLETLPDFYGAEQELGEVSLTDGEELVLSYAGIEGDYPARARLVVDNTSDYLQRGLIVGVRSRHQSDAATAQLAYAATDMTPLGTVGAAPAPLESVSAEVVTGTASNVQWTPLLTTDLDVDGALTHVGTYRVWVRAGCSDADGVPPRLRLVWDVGDLAAPIENTPTRLPSIGDMWGIDLGEVRLDTPPIGAHQWRGQIQALGDEGLEIVHLDRVRFVPVDDSYTVLRAPDNNVQGLVGLSAADAFTDITPGSNLNGRTPPTGAAWATIGAATDFQAADLFADAPSPLAVARAQASISPRFASFGPVMSDQIVIADFVSRGPSGYCGVLARFVDSSNHLRFVVRRLSSFWAICKIIKQTGGVGTDLATAYCADVFDDGGQLQLNVGEDGVAVGWVLDRAGNYLATLTTPADADLETGGDLETGQGGIIDAGNGVNSDTRWYDNVTVSGPGLSPAVAYPGRSAQLGWDGAYRENPDESGVYGKLAVTGDLFRLPPSGLEERTIEVLAIASRGDFDTTPDNGLDSLTARVLYRPTYLSPLGE